MHGLGLGDGREEEIMAVSGMIQVLEQACSKQKLDPNFHTLK